VLTTRSARHGRRTRSSARRATYRRGPRSIARLVVGAIVAVVVIAGGSAFFIVSSGTPDRVLSERVTHEPPATAEAQTAVAEPVPTAEPVPAAVPVSVLSDSHAYFAASWWRQTVEAGAIEGVSMGAFASQPGAVAATIASGLDEAAAAAQGGYVLVQAGTNDLLAGSSPTQAAADIQALWAGVRDRGSTPIAVLVPPSSEVGAEVIELNRLLVDGAAVENVAVLDVYTPVAEADGSWQAGTSDDGKHANLTGASLQANEVLVQLPALLAG
jgi:lysophospholipase L1-like esterase